MNKVKAVLLAGKTCTLKTYLGLVFAQMFAASPASFGQLKRIEILRKTDLGLEIERNLGLGFSIPPVAAFEVVKKMLDRPLAFISGFPVSAEEYDLLEKKVEILGIIHLTAREDVMRHRFFNTDVCPICNWPGEKDYSCPLHRQKFIERPDRTEEEYRVRHRLYVDRLLPFLEGAKAESHYQGYLDSELPKDALLKEGSRIVKSILSIDQLKP